jgi:hypothetical protein
MDSAEINRYHQMLKAYIPSDRLMTPQEVHTILSQTNCQIYEMMKIMASTFKLGYKSGYKDTVELFKFYVNLVDSFNGYVYNLGDSLDKLAFSYNVMKNQERIITIPLSGSFYNDDMSIDFEKKAEVDAKLRDLVNNNPGLQSLINNLQQGNHVLITDYGLTGKGALTFEYIMDALGVPLDNLIFLQFTMNYEVINENIAHSKMKNKLVNVVTDLDELVVAIWLTNSENFQARCTPKYPVNLWSYNIPAVYDNNYYNCNLNRLFFTMEVTKLLGKC